MTAVLQKHGHGDNLMRTECSRKHKYLTNRKCVWSENKGGKNKVNGAELMEAVIDMNNEKKSFVCTEFNLD